MKALHGRRAGRRQPIKIDPSPAANDSAVPEPDDPASAEALAARDPKTGTGSEASRCLSPFSGRDRTGWPPHPSERRDFYHRIRVFPPEMAGWRKRMVREIAADPMRFPSVAGATPDKIQARFDDGISYLREVARILAVLYGTPDLGNKPDPTDELVYIILARHTREGAYQAAYGALKKRFPRWDDLLDAPRRVIEKLVYSGGLSTKKTLALRAALRKLRQTFGHCTLEPARAWSDEKLEEFLCTLPEIQRKSAYCIMMYSFGRQVFPADTHVGRVLSRLGPNRELGVSLEGRDHKKLQGDLADLVPPNLRHGLHVNLVQHGRTICRSERPLCDQCELRNFCQHYRKQETVRLTNTESPTVIDLFAGAGGMSEGFGRAGFKVLAAVEMDEMAARTYRLNHPGLPEDRVIVQDIRTIPPGTLRRLANRGTLDVLAGAPPCQGFSMVGFRSKKSRTGYVANADKRNSLFEFMISAALELRPKLFLMENVPGMQSVKRENLSYLETAAEMLQQAVRAAGPDQILPRLPD